MKPAVDSFPLLAAFGIDESSEVSGAASRLRCMCVCVSERERERERESEGVGNAWGLHCDSDMEMYGRMQAECRRLWIAMVKKRGRRISWLLPGITRLQGKLH